MENQNVPGGTAMRGHLVFQKIDTEICHHHNFSIQLTVPVKSCLHDFDKRFLEQERLTKFIAPDITDYKSIIIKNLLTRLLKCTERAPRKIER